MLLPRLALETTLSRDGMFDGAWWPRTLHIEDELPDLITALSAHYGHILRVGLDTSAWDTVPRSVQVHGLEVRIARFSASGDTMSLTRGLQDQFVLLVVPPDTDPLLAATAMSRAAGSGNRATAAELLAPGRPA
ncbi:DUF5994 family protein [Kitasatospora sp. NPDC048540]|uniref:DUF5994 family protein n=1 Tax=unclassified Kitasatospora TaxID=2633591 RepID=UPI000691E09B|nr:DUF5994 family protein [Kitasatospora sp. MBT63]